MRILIPERSGDLATPSARHFAGRQLPSPHAGDHVEETLEATDRYRGRSEQDVQFFCVHGYSTENAHRWPSLQTQCVESAHRAVPRMPDNLLRCLRAIQ
jgi:hypothetical protein